MIWRNPYRLKQQQRDSYKNIDKTWENNNKQMKEWENKWRPCKNKKYKMEEDYMSWNLKNKGNKDN